jgi:hypothetical protein
MILTYQNRKTTIEKTYTLKKMKKDKLFFHQSLTLKPIQKII